MILFIVNKESGRELRVDLGSLFCWLYVGIIEVVDLFREIYICSYDCEEKSYKKFLTKERREGNQC